MTRFAWTERAETAILALRDSGAIHPESAEAAMETLSRSETFDLDDPEVDINKHGLLRIRFRKEDRGLELWIGRVSTRVTMMAETRFGPLEAYKDFFGEGRLDVMRQHEALMTRSLDEW
jgi:hypothetical protein